MSKSNHKIGFNHLKLKCLNLLNEIQQFGKLDLLRIVNMNSKVIKPRNEIKNGKLDRIFKSFPICFKENP